MLKEMDWMFDGMEILEGCDWWRRYLWVAVWLLGVVVGELIRVRDSRLLKGIIYSVNFFI